MQSKDTKNDEETTMRRPVASDADEGVAWFASPAGFGSESPFSVSDANEMDDTFASR
jgi:hypothetical protein